MARKLAAEVAMIRRAGTPVLVVQPTAEALEVMGRDSAGPARRDVAAVAHACAVSRLGRRDGRGLASLIASAAGSS
jgi:hypothetical protein